MPKQKILLNYLMTCPGRQLLTDWQAPLMRLWTVVGTQSQYRLLKQSNQISYSNPKSMRRFRTIISKDFNLKNLIIQTKIYICIVCTYLSTDILNTLLDQRGCKRIVVGGAAQVVLPDLILKSQINKAILNNSLWLQMV